MMGNTAALGSAPRDWQDGARLATSLPPRRPAGLARPITLPASPVHAPPGYRDTFQKRTVHLAWTFALIYKPSDFIQGFIAHSECQTANVRRSGVLVLVAIKFLYN
jgi:hypothetical protein